MFKFNLENHLGHESIYHDGANYWRETRMNKNDKLMTLEEYNAAIKKLGEADAASKKADFEFKVGDVVEYIGEDSYYKGTIVCIFTKLNGRSVRAAVENDDGLLLIKSLSNAKLYILGPNHEQPKAE
jgi:hypothetical protein